MFNRIKRITKAHTKKLIRRMERAACVLDEARSELRTKAGELMLEAEKLEAVSKKLQGTDTALVLRYTETVGKLRDQALALKEKYEEFGVKSSLLLARKTLAESQLRIHVSSGEGSALDLLAGLEEEVDNLEAEVRANEKLWG